MDRLPCSVRNRSFGIAHAWSHFNASIKTVDMRTVNEQHGEVRRLS